ncbi:MAG: hypothetical protein M5U12_24980 [Verrucomicrobia bacterium]|nr:hypothetical protein [Verrucomicrobiota bacterium]
MELYRRLAQIRDRTTLETFQREVRDRFGTPPPAVELLFQVSALKLVAAERNVTAIETREDKVLLERGGDYVTIGDRFPRLTKRTPAARLNEIRRLLLSL